LSDVANRQTKSHLRGDGTMSRFPGLIWPAFSSAECCTLLAPGECLGAGGSTAVQGGPLSGLELRSQRRQCEPSLMSTWSDPPHSFAPDLVLSRSRACDAKRVDGRITSGDSGSYPPRRNSRRAHARASVWGRLRPVPDAGSSIPLVVGVQPS